MITYEIAKKYLDKGWPVFPVFLSKKNGKISKIPAVKWKKYQTELPTDEDLHRWFDKPKYNAIGMATGKLSRLVVIDVDDDSQDFNSSMVVKTISGKKHFYYRWTEEIRNDEAINDKPLDFRGDGGFVVLPPSSLDGKSYTWEKEIETMYLEPIPEDLKKLLKIRKEKMGAGQPFNDSRVGSIPEGARNNFFKSAILSYLNKHDEETAWILTKAVNREKCKPPMNERELREKFDYIRNKFSKNIEENQNKAKNLTDTTNAEQIADMFGDKLRFDHKRKRWLLWNEHRWKPDNEGELNRLAVEAARQQYVEAAEISDLRQREAAARWAIASESRPKIDAATYIAKSIKPIADDGENWDSNPMLLSCPNGIVDLKTGILRDGRSEDRITMQTSVGYDSSAKCPRWEQFINEIFEGNEELIRYVHKALGYSITGDVSEQVAFFCFGTGANGKSVLFKTIRRILEDYGYDAPASLLQRNYSSSSNDVAATEFKRFLVSSEALSTSKLNEQRLKAWTGGDRVSARYLYSEFFSFDPTVKPWLFVNHKPKVEDDSFGFWRRVRLIPFNAKFAGETDDKKLQKKLQAEHEGILNWLVRGCLLWQEEGLEPTPNVVSEETQTYQAENDELYDFLIETYPEKVEEEKAITAYKKYRAWAENNGFKKEDILSNTNFGRRMADKFVKSRTKYGIFYKNVGTFEAGCRQNPTFSRLLHTRDDRNSFRKRGSNPTPEANNPTPANNRLKGDGFDDPQPITTRHPAEVEEDDRYFESEVEEL